MLLVLFFSCHISLGFWHSKHHRLLPDHQNLQSIFFRWHHQICSFTSKAHFLSDEPPYRITGQRPQENGVCIKLLSNFPRQLYSVAEEADWEAEQGRGLGRVEEVGKWLRRNLRLLALLNLIIMWHHKSLV